MSPETHLMASWLVAAYTTRNRRDCRLVALSGILPDADGVGLVADLTTRWAGWPETSLYSTYHHYLMHGMFGACLTALLLACFAREHWRVLGLSLAVFHFHLLCDFVASRGPSRTDIWPIHYLGPISREPMWWWHGQWALDAWQNIAFTWILIAWCLGLAVRRGDSFVGVVNRWADDVFVRVLRKWSGDLRRLFKTAEPR